MKGFSKPHKNVSRKVKLAKTRDSRVDTATGLPKGIALPERNKKKQRQLERYAKIVAREEAAKVAARPDTKMA